MRRSPGVEPLRVVPAAEVEIPDGPAWLVHDLWGETSVGILGGAPKSAKTWLALEIALSVASGKPVLGRFGVPRRGPVLVFAAEDAPAMVRTRLEGLARKKEVSLPAVPVRLILASRLRLDRPEDQERLTQTVRLHTPRLLVLDPFVRIYGSIDENAAGEVAGILGYLRELSRTEKTSILVVHHARKSAASGEHAGLSLRGSGDFYAWTDQTLTLRRKQGTTLLSIEHRNAPSPEPLALQLRTDNGEPPHLALVTPPVQPPDPDGLRQRIIERLDLEDAPATQEALRSTLRVRMQRLVDTLRRMEAEGLIARSPAGWSRPP